MNKSEFLEVVNTFLKKTDISSAAFGKNTVNDTRLVFMLRKGRECRESTQEKVLSWMAAYEKEHGVVIVSGATSAAGTSSTDSVVSANGSSLAKAAA